MSYKLYKNNTLIKKIYKGSTPIKKIYKGSTLIWQADPFEPSTDVFYKTGPATYSGTLPQGVYDLIIAGGGGEGNSWNVYGVVFHNAGGSGAVWEGVFYNPKDQPCKIYAGNVKEDSYLELGGVRMITAGKGGNFSGGTTGHPGDGGIITVNSALQIVEERKKSNGKTGARGTTGTAPTASVCSINNWGQGSWCQEWKSPNWVAGGVKLVYLRMDK